MTTAAWILVAVAGAVALTDWFAVATEHVRLEYAAKPLTMVPLIAAALALTPVDGAMRGWFVAALVFSLVGDVFLMLPGDKWFIPGVGSFLVAHLCYVPGFASAGISTPWAIAGAVVVALALAAVAPRVVRGAREKDPALGIPITVYIAVISVMVVSAVGSTVPVAIAGAALFYLSDLTIGWTRFIGDVWNGRLVIITTYHLAQALLVISLTIPR